MTEQEKQILHDNIAKVREQIAQAAVRSGRSASDITLVAATKMNAAARVREAMQSGIDAAGENRVQELLEKYEENAYLDKPLHFIGTLQTNKVKYLIGKVDLIHSVSSVKLGQAIGKEAMKHGCVQDILIEVNIAHEASKSGLLPEALDETIDELRQNAGIHICGLMAIPPILTGNQKNIVYFDKMRQLSVDISAKKYDNVSMRYLSMGMSSDFADAIECGSNMVRVGQAIFGARQY